MFPKNGLREDVQRRIFVWRIIFTFSFTGYVGWMDGWMNEGANDGERKQRSKRWFKIVFQNQRDNKYDGFIQQCLSNQRDMLHCLVRLQNVVRLPQSEKRFARRRRKLSMRRLSFSQSKLTWRRLIADAKQTKFYWKSPCPKSLKSWLHSKKSSELKEHVQSLLLKAKIVLFVHIIIMRQKCSWTQENQFCADDVETKTTSIFFFLLYSKPLAISRISARFSTAQDGKCSRNTSNNCWDILLHWCFIKTSFLDMHN